MKDKFSINKNVNNKVDAMYKMAGDESDGGNTLLADFILFCQKLEKLGFTYHQGKVMVVEPEEVQNV